MSNIAVITLEDVFGFLGAACASSQVLVQSQGTNDANLDCHMFYVISDGTITDSVYLAVLRNPGAEMVAWTVHIGLKEVIAVLNLALADVVEYLTDRCHDFRDGAPTIWIQDTIPLIDFRKEPYAW